MRKEKSLSLSDFCGWEYLVERTNFKILDQGGGATQMALWYLNGKHATILTSIVVTNH